MATKYEKVISLMVRTNMSQREIAQELDMAEETISRYKKRKDFRDRTFEAEREFLGEISSEGVRTMRNLLSAKSEMVRFNAAKDILDRTGHLPVTKSEVQVTEPPKFEDDIS